MISEHPVREGYQVVWSERLQAHLEVGIEQVGAGRRQPGKESRQKSDARRMRLRQFSTTTD